MAALLWCIGIYAFTASPVSTGANTKGLIEQAIPAGAAASAVVNVILRKAGHMVAFGVLAVFVYMSMRPGKKAFAISWLIATGYGALDEWHQSFVPGRAAAWTDAGIDSLGALAALLLIGAVRPRNKKSTEH